MRYRLMLVIVVVLVSLAERSTISAQGTTYTDPFAYCAAVGTIDAPDARYVGPAVPDAVVRGLQTAMQLPSDAPADQFRAGMSWRCMEGQVYACSVGANLPCVEKADTSQTPTADMTAYCQADANADVIPAFVTGHTTVYAWSCRNGVATPGRQVMQVDAGGFVSNFWHISPQGTPDAQMMPSTGRAGIVVAGTVALIGLGAIVALGGLVVRRRAAVQ